LGAQVKLNPFVDSSLDIVETLLTLILLFLACCGMIFSAYDPAGFEEWHYNFLGWLAYLSMVLGSLLCSALLANEAFEHIYAWYLNRVSFLGDASDDPRHVEEELAYSKSATAHVIKDLPTSSIDAKATKTSFVAPNLLKRVSQFGSYVPTQAMADKEVSSEDTKLFYNVNLLRFRQSMHRLSPSDRSSCVQCHSLKFRRVVTEFSCGCWAGFKHLCDSFFGHCVHTSETAQVASLSFAGVSCLNERPWRNGGCE
jgi:hypothetical protein